MNSLLKIEDTIKRIEPIPQQVPLADTVALPRTKEVLTGTTILRVEGNINTNKNIHYPPTLPQTPPSTSVTNK